LQESIFQFRTSTSFLYILHTLIIEIGGAHRVGLLLKVVVALGVRNLTPLAGTAEPGGLEGNPPPQFQGKNN